MKKLLLILTAALMLVSVLPSFGGGLAYSEPEVRVVLDGQPMQFDVAPRIIDGRTMVPFRAIFEALGAEVDWNDEYQSIRAATANGATITFFVGDKTVFTATSYMAVSDFQLDIAPIIVDSRTLVPLRFVSETLGALVDWQEPSNTVLIHTTRTPLIDEPAATLAQAQAWAIDRNAHQRFVEIAEVYWYYGEILGIRPDILFAQAAKETAFGRFTGAVLPEMNNWAGVKVRHSVADETHDHETFETPAEGVRAHFNHMAAYVGLPPFGIPHPRFELVLMMPWAGTIVYVEELSGRWAPDIDYGVSVLNGFTAEMTAHSETPRPRVVYIDPYNEVIAIASIVEQELHARGIIVVVAEPQTYLSQRIAEAAAIGADVFVSLSFGATNEAEIFFHPRRANSISLARYMYDEVNTITAAEARLLDGLARNLDEIRLPNMTSVLLNVDSLYNHELAANAITRGILRFYGVNN